jgi:hypothetical protein
MFGFELPLLFGKFDFIDLITKGDKFDSVGCKPDLGLECVVCP